MPKIQVKDMPKGTGKVEIVDDFFGTIYDAENDCFENEVQSHSQDRRNSWNSFVESIHSDYGTAYAKEEE